VGAGNAVLAGAGELLATVTDACRHLRQPARPGQVKVVQDQDQDQDQAGAVNVVQCDAPVPMPGV
jgi:hypothetical protein